jgi:hypothetical protein
MLKVIRACLFVQKQPRWIRKFCELSNFAGINCQLTFKHIGAKCFLLRLFSLYVYFPFTSFFLLPLLI